METFFFWLFSSVAVLSALSILFVRRPTRALLALLLCMLCLSVLYTLLHAYFVAIVHLIVYAGAVMVLFLFVIMLEGLGATTLPFLQRFNKPYLVLTSLSAIVFAILITKIMSTAHLPPLQQPVGTIENLGRVLFSNYLLPFELISVLILLGIFAAVSLAQNKKGAVS